MREFKDLKIAVAGTGYVGLSIATLLSQHHQVTAVDIIPEKVDLINNKKSPIQDDYIEKYLAEKELNLTATLDAKEAYSDADFVVIAAPTNYDSKKNFFDTSAVEAVIKLVIEYAGITVFANAGSNILNFIHAKKYCSLKFDIGLALKRHLKPIMIIFALSILLSCIVYGMCLILMRNKVIWAFFKKKNKSELH